MNGYNFTEHVRKVLAMAREEAERLRHEYVSTEHILLGLIRQRDGVAAVVLQNLSVDVDEVRQKVEEAVKKGKSTQITGPDLPYTSRAKKVVELAMSEARQLNHTYVGTQHLLLGLLGEEKGIAAQVLTLVGLSVESVRQDSLRLLGAPMRSRRNDVGSGESGRALRPVLFTLQVDCEGGTWFEERFERAADAIAYLEALSGRRGDGGDAPER